MTRGGVAGGLVGELALLQLGIGRHAAIAIAVRQLEHRVVQGVEAGQGHELELVAHGPQLTLELGDGGVVQLGLPVEGGRAVVGHQLAGVLLLHGLGELLGVVQVRVRGLPPQQVGDVGIGQAARDAMIQARALLQAEEALGGAVFAVDEGLVALVDVRGDQLGAFGVGAGDRDGRRAHDVGGQTGGDQIAFMRLGRDQHLAAQVAALLLRRQLVLEVDAGGARLDEGLHDLEAVQRAAEAGFRIGDDRGEPVALGAALGVLDLVGALQGAVDAAAQFRRGVRRVQRLVRIHGRSGVGVGRDLPA